MIGDARKRLNQDKQKKYFNKFEKKNHFKNYIIAKYFEATNLHKFMIISFN